jgi:excisionase family DNA binding protein
MNTPLDQVSSSLLDTIVEQVAQRIAEIVLDRLRTEGWSPGRRSDEQLLGVEAAAAKLAVPPSAIYKLTASGRLPAVKVGGRLRIRRADIDQFIIDNVRTDQRVSAMARAAQAGATAGTSRSRPRPSRTTSRRRVARSAPPSHDATEATLKVVTNDDPNATPTRRSG